MAYSDLKSFPGTEIKLCPVCGKGALLVGRDQTTFALPDVDCCTQCDQVIVYTDEMIAVEPVQKKGAIVSDVRQKAKDLLKLASDERTPETP